jgi:hypothetical protein
MAFLPFAVHVDPNIVSDPIAYNYVAWLLDQPGWSPILYPPLIFYTAAAFLFPMLTVSLLPEFPLGAVPGDLMAWLSSPYIFRTLTLTRVWYIGFDLLGAIFLWRIFRHEPRKARRALAFWLFNPIIIYDAYIHGQLDVMPLLFVVLSLYKARGGRARWAAFWMGIGACYKNFPFFFLLPLVIILAKSWRERLVLLLCGVVPYMLLWIPFAGSYSASVGIYPDRFFKAGYDLGFGARIYLFFIFYAALLWYLYHRKAHTLADLWRACFAILLIYYQFGYFDLHYWSWIVPFAAIYWVERPKEARPFYIVVLACLLVLTAPAPLARFLAPISPGFFLRLPSLLEALNPYLPMLFIINVVRSMLAGTCFYLACKLVRDMPTTLDFGTAAGNSASSDG